MSAIARRAAVQAVRSPLRAQFSTTVRRRAVNERDIGADNIADKKVDLKQGAKRDPELYV
jgi:hypothetical protein